MTRILVVYATTDGHTRKVAASLGDALRTRGAQVDVFEAGRPVPRPDTYEGVVVAGSVHGGHYQRAIVHWVRENRQALNDKPTALVSVCLAVLQEPPKGPQAAAQSISDFLMLTGWKPTVSKTVAGALLYTKYNWLKRWLMKQIASKQGGDTNTTRDHEYTDWIELRAFACQFGQLVDATAAVAHPSAAA